GHSFIDPIGSLADLCIRQTAFAGKLTIIVSRMPRRHVARLRDTGDECASFLHVVIRDQRKRRGFARPVACDTVLVENRSNLLAERGRAGLSSKKRYGAE